MRRALFWLVALLGISPYGLGQATSSDAQTLQALLTELRALHQDLRVSLNRAQSMQILLARFQMQQGVVTRASDRLNDSRQRLVDDHVHQKELAAQVKQLEDALSGAENPQQQADLQDRIKHVKSDLEIAGSIVQQHQTAEIESEQQLREEQDKLNALESQLDELIRTMGNSNEKSSANRP
jgi:chromosome segregation ATPase